MGVGILPLAEDVCYVVHGTSLHSSKNIAKHGLNRGGRLHIHFYACNRNGDIRGAQHVRIGSQAIVIAASNAAREAGIMFYRSNNAVILSGGIDGVIPPPFIRAIRLLPTYDLLWANADRAWKVNEPAVNGNPFGHIDSDHEENAMTSDASPHVHEENPVIGDGWESESAADEQMQPPPEGVTRVMSKAQMQVKEEETSVISQDAGADADVDQMSESEDPFDDELST